MVEMLHYAALFLLVIATPVIADGIVDNGDFKKGPKSSAMNGTQIIGNLPGWHYTGIVEYIKSGQDQGGMHVVIPEGEAAIRLGNDSSIMKKIKVTKGTFYAITFSVVRTCSQDEVLNVSVTPEFSLLPVQTIYDSSGWNSYSWGFLATMANVELSFHHPGEDKEDAICGPLVDAVTIQTLVPPSLVGNNLVRNGDFEEGPYLSEYTTRGVLIPPVALDKHSPLPSWIVLSNTKVVRYIDSKHYSVLQGNRSVEFIAGRETSLAQDIETQPGKTYFLNFLMGDAADSCFGPMMVMVSAATKKEQFKYQSNGSGGSESKSWNFTAIGSNTRVYFSSDNYHMNNIGSLCGPVIDDIVITSLY